MQMTESEVDAIVARLVPEYEAAKLKALIARQDFLVVSTGTDVDRKVAGDARERWLELEDYCTAILQRIDSLAEASMA
jgi:hypothetical protein